MRREKKEREGKEGRKEETRLYMVDKIWYFLLSFFYLFSFFHFYDYDYYYYYYYYYYWTRLRCVASDPGNSWCSVKKRVLSFEGFLVILETLLFLSFFLMTLSFLNSFFLVFRDNECWLCLSSLCLFYFMECVNLNGCE